MLIKITLTKLLFSIKNTFTLHTYKTQPQNFYFNVQTDIGKFSTVISDWVSDKALLENGHSRRTFWANWKYEGLKPPLEFVSGRLIFYVTWHALQNAHVNLFKSPLYHTIENVELDLTIMLCALTRVLRIKCISSVRLL